MISSLHSDKGSLLIELIVVIGIIVTAFGGILGVVAHSFVASKTVQQTNEAVVLAEEMLEAVRNYRDGIPWDQDSAGVAYDGLGVLGAVAGDFHLEKSTDLPPKWMIVSGTETVREFTRSMEFTRLQRDAYDDIVVSGTPDPESVQVAVTVSWSERRRAHEIELVAYLTNWQQL